MIDRGIEGVTGFLGRWLSPISHSARPTSGSTATNNAQYLLRLRMGHTPFFPFVLRIRSISTGRFKAIYTFGSGVRVEGGGRIRTELVHRAARQPITHSTYFGLEWAIHLFFPLFSIFVIVFRLPMLAWPNERSGSAILSMKREE
jgi:hypothetical protein